MINLTKNEEQLTAEVMGKINLSKDKDKLEKSVVNLSKTIVNLSKENNIDLSTLQAQVVVVVDYSGSMSKMYERGVVQKVITKLVPLGLSFDDNGSIEVFRFETGFKQFESLNIDNYSNYIDEQVYADRGNEFGATYYAPVIREIKRIYIDGEDSSITAMKSKKKKGGFFSRLLGQTNKGAEDGNTIETGSDDPVFVIFITDGDNYDKDNTNSIIREISKHNMFIQFIGIGNARFDYLELLDNIDGRECDNTGFTKFADIENVKDYELYNSVLSEFANWLSTKK